MKFTKLKPLAKEDMGEAPEYITEKILPRINEVINSINETFSRLDIDNNFNKENFNIKLKTGVEEIITYTAKQKPTRVWLDSSDGALVSGFSWSYVGSNGIKVKVVLDRPQADCAITLLF